MADRLASLAWCCLPLRRHDHHAASTAATASPRRGRRRAQRAARPARGGSEPGEPVQPGKETDPGERGSGSRCQRSVLVEVRQSLVIARHGSPPHGSRSLEVERPVPCVGDAGAIRAQQLLGFITRAIGGWCHSNQPRSRRASIATTTAAPSPRQRGEHHGADRRGITASRHQHALAQRHGSASVERATIAPAARP